METVDNLMSIEERGQDGVIDVDQQSRQGGIRPWQNDRFIVSCRQFLGTYK